MNMTSVDWEKTKIPLIVRLCSPGQEPRERRSRAGAQMRNIRVLGADAGSASRTIGHLVVPRRMTQSFRGNPCSDAA